ncbi:unnamed protein product [Pleuronectes platessa]|uniref:Uncharacterized protein n=1 Tax=Pleuronectes platessa TaxID=8262 RepID=A0A9N7Z3N0_PLEPL|nr:unnamed protein product [Pleuronectes platessa]
MTSFLSKPGARAEGITPERSGFCSERIPAETGVIHTRARGRLPCAEPETLKNPGFIPFFLREQLANWNSQVLNESLPNRTHKVTTSAAAARRCSSKTPRAAVREGRGSLGPPHQRAESHMAVSFQRVRAEGQSADGTTWLRTTQIAGRTFTTAGSHAPLHRHLRTHSKCLPSVKRYQSGCGGRSGKVRFSLWLVRIAMWTPSFDYHHLWRTAA